MTGIGKKSPQRVLYLSEERAERVVHLRIHLDGCRCPTAH